MTVKGKQRPFSSLGRKCINVYPEIGQWMRHLELFYAFALNHVRTKVGAIRCFIRCQDSSPRKTTNEAKMAAP